MNDSIFLGGTLRIFGESLNKDVPYKTLLLSTKDSASFVVKEILEKYGYDKEDPALYCLVQVIVPPHGQNDSTDLQNNGGIKEYILDDDDCPLTIQHQHNRNRGMYIFLILILIVMCGIHLKFKCYILNK